MKVLELLKETGGTGDSERTGLKGVIYEIKQIRRLSSHKPFESLSSVMAFRLLRFFFRLLCRLFSVRFYSLVSTFRSSVSEEFRMKFTANGKCLLPSHLQSSLCELILKYFNLFE